MTGSTGVVIQARTDSSRFPSKVLKKIMGRSVLFHVIERCKKFASADKVILATTNRAKDDILSAIAGECRIGVYRGSIDDVLDRYYQCAKDYGLENIIRVTADCPFLDIDLGNMVINRFLNSRYDYGRTGLSYPDGLNIEIFSFESLNKAWNCAKLRSEREHVTPYFWKNPELFKILNVESESDLSIYCLTLDYPEDLIFIRKIYKKLFHIQKTFGLQAIIDLLKSDSKSIIACNPKVFCI